MIKQLLGNNTRYTPCKKNLPKYIDLGLCVPQTVALFNHMREVQTTKIYKYKEE